MSIQEKSRGIEISMCVRVYHRAAIYAAKCITVGTLESLSLSFTLLFVSYRVFLRLPEVYKGAVRQIREGCETRNESLFTLDTIWFVSRMLKAIIHNKINLPNLVASERLNRESRSPLEACRHTPHSSLARCERLASTRMRVACRIMRSTNGDKWTTGTRDPFS